MKGFVIVNVVTVNTLGNETLGLQANDRQENFEKVVNSASQNHVIGSNADDRVGDAADSAVTVVEKCMHDAILTAMTYMLTPRVEMAARLIRGSSKNGPNSLVQNLDRRDFTGNTENTPLRSASSRLGLSIEQDELDETHDVDDSEDGDLLATRVI